MSRDVLIHKADLLLALDADGKPVELHHALRLVRELRTALADYEADAIHTCGPDCKRPLCVLRAELAALHGTLERVRSASRDQRDADAFFLREARAVRLALSEELAASRDEARRLADELAALRAQEPRSALLWLLWHHQGASSPIGQPIRRLLGIGQHDRLTDDQLAEAKSYAAPAPAAVPDTLVGTLLKFNAWRKGEVHEWNVGTSGPDPQEITKAIDTACALLSAATAPASVPDGYALVPVEPTPTMLDVAVSHALMVSLGGDYNWSAYMRDVWGRMLAAAPSATQEVKP